MSSIFALLTKLFFVYAESLSLMRALQSWQSQMWLKYSLILLPVLGILWNIFYGRFLLRILIDDHCVNIKQDFTSCKLCPSITQNHQLIVLNVFFNKSGIIEENKASFPESTTIINIFYYHRSMRTIMEKPMTITKHNNRSTEKKLTKNCLLAQFSLRQLQVHSKRQP